MGPSWRCHFKLGIIPVINSLFKVDNTLCFGKYSFDFICLICMEFNTVMIFFKAGAIKKSDGSDFAVQI